MERERERAQDGVSENWKGLASVFFPAKRWVVCGSKASLERRGWIQGKPGEAWQQVMMGHVPAGEAGTLTLAACDPCCHRGEAD